VITSTTFGADIPQAIVASMTAVKFLTDVTELKIQFIVNDNYFSVGTDKFATAATGAPDRFMNPELFTSSRLPPVAVLARATEATDLWLLNTTPSLDAMTSRVC